jgi:hypothetical protein
MKEHRELSQKATRVVLVRNGSGLEQSGSDGGEMSGQCGEMAKRSN